MGDFTFNQLPESTMARIADFIESGSLLHFSKRRIKSLSLQISCCVFAVQPQKTHSFPAISALGLRTVNPFVVGSSPTGGAVKKKPAKFIVWWAFFVFGMLVTST